MMCKKQKTGWLMLRAFCTIPMMALALDASASSTAMQQETGWTEARPDTVVAQGNDEDKVHDICDQKAEYVGGTSALLKFLGENLHYPEASQAHGIQARILVQYVVEKDGTCSSFHVIRNDAHDTHGVGIDALVEAAKEKQQRGEPTATPEEVEGWSKALEEEALRVCRIMPKWIPARHEGQVVRMRFTLPLTFRLK